MEFTAFTATFCPQRLLPLGVLFRLFSHHLTLSFADFSPLLPGVEILENFRNPVFQKVVLGHTVMLQTVKGPTSQFAHFKFVVCSPR